MFGSHWSCAHWHSLALSKTVPSVFASICSKYVSASCILHSVLGKLLVYGV